MTSSAPVPFSFPVDVAALPAGGRDFVITVDAAGREAIARALGLESLEKLTASLTLRPAAGNTVTASGHLEADLVQACVVSLQPVPAHLAEAISRRFVAAPEPRTKPPAAEPERFVDPNEEVIDPIVDGRIDLGEVLTEQLALAIDPYPRAPGVAFAGLPGAESPPAAGQGPFAALAALKVAKAAPRRGAGDAEGGGKRRPSRGKSGR